MIAKELKESIKDIDDDQTIFIYTGDDKEMILLEISKLIKTEHGFVCLVPVSNRELASN